MGYATEYICEAGSIIIGRKGNINSPVYATSPFWNVDTAFGLVADVGLNSKFLFYFCKSYDFSLLNRGTTIPSLVKSELLEINIPVPPLPEQQRIVGILDEAFEGIEKAKANAQRNLDNAREVFESYLNEVFTKRGEGWVEYDLGNVCELFQGLCINAKTKHLIVQHSEFPLLRIKDLRNNSEEIFVTKSGCPINSFVNESEIIYTRTGQIGLVFRGRKGVLHNNCFKVIPNKKILNDYLFWWLQNPEFKKNICRLASKAAQADITHGLFKVQKILLPTFQEQINIVDYVIKLKANSEILCSAYTRKLAALDEFKQSLLHRAFNGEL